MSKQKSNNTCQYLLVPLHCQKPFKWHFPRPLAWWGEIDPERSSQGSCNKPTSHHQRYDEGPTSGATLPMKGGLPASVHLGSSASTTTQLLSMPIDMPKTGTAPASLLGIILEGDSTTSTKLSSSLATHSVTIRPRTIDRSSYQITTSWSPPLLSHVGETPPMVTDRENSNSSWWSQRKPWLYDLLTCGQGAKYILRLTGNKSPQEEQETSIVTSRKMR